MNRITRILHKNSFLSRQRHALKYSHKYVISDRQLELESKKAKAKDDMDKDFDCDKDADKVLIGFDPENNKQDRRILFEVTGMRIALDEFRAEESSASDSDQEDDHNAGDRSAAINQVRNQSYFDLENAYMYGNSGLLEDEDNSNQTLSNAINP